MAETAVSDLARSDQEGRSTRGRIHPIIVIMWTPFAALFAAIAVTEYGHRRNLILVTLLVWTALHAFAATLCASGTLAVSGGQWRVRVARQRTMRTEDIVSLRWEPYTSYRVVGPNAVFVRIGLTAANLVTSAITWVITRKPAPRWGTMVLTDRNSKQLRVGLPIFDLAEFGALADTLPREVVDASASDVLTANPRVTATTAPVSAVVCRSGKLVVVVSVALAAVIGFTQPLSAPSRQHAVENATAVVSDFLAANLPDGAAVVYPKPCTLGGASRDGQTVKDVVICDVVVSYPTLTPPVLNYDGLEATDPVRVALRKTGDSDFTVTGIGYETGATIGDIVEIGDSGFVATRTWAASKLRTADTVVECVFVEAFVSAPMTIAEACRTAEPFDPVYYPVTISADMTITRVD